MATTSLRHTSTRPAPLGEPSLIGKDDMMAGMMGGPTSALGDNGTSLIARAEALNAFMKMQPAANQARAETSTVPPRATTATTSRPPPQPAQSSGCLCFGGPAPRSAPAPSSGGRRTVDSRDASGAGRPKREYYPDNLSVQPARHPWTKHMEWLILACVDFLEIEGLDERNLFAVSAVDDLVRNMHVNLGASLPRSTDPHVAAGVIKAQIRHANEPLVSKDCLRAYIEAQAPESEQAQRQAAESGAPQGTTASAASYADSHLAKTVDTTEVSSSPRRAYILARIMRLLGRVSANVEESKMNAHSLAKCVAPSMLHWDPNSSFALLMLGKITAFVMAMIEDARVFDEKLCQKIDELYNKSQ